MKIAKLAGILGLALSLGVAGQAQAAGCIKGAVVGGVAGHYAGHHAVLGAMGGCVVGRRLARDKAARARAEQQQQQGAPAGNGYAQPAPTTAE